MTTSGHHLRSGDMVKLTDRFADTLMAGKHMVDWRARRGIVRRANGYAVFVVWHGRNTVDQLPVKAVEEARQ